MTVELGTYRELVFDSGLRDFKDDRLAHLSGFHSQSLADKEC